MSRDMKPRKSANRTRKKSAGGTLLGLFVGLVIGVLAAASVVWYIHRTPPPFTARTPPPTQTASVQTPLVLSGKPGDPVPQEDDKPRFDFYKILPDNGEMASEPNTAATKPDDPKQTPDAAFREAIFLQTGSFSSAGDADNQKAGLAMMGIEAEVQQVMLQDKVWYRVRLGPFGRIEEVDTLRAELARQGIEANIVKRN